MSINLSNLSAAARAQRARDRMFARGILLALLLLVLTFGSFLGLKAYNESLRNRIAGQEVSIDRKAKDLSGKKAAEIIDVSDRIGETLKFSTAENTPLVFLERAAALLADGVVLDEYSYDIEDGEITINLSAEAENFSAIASQVARLKQAGDFDDVSARDVQRDDQTGKLRFVTVLRVKVQEPKGVAGCKMAPGQKISN